MTQHTVEPRVGVAFAAIVLAMLPAVLDQTILATALPVIASDLGSLSDVSWVVSAYVVAAAAATPLWGKLGDRHGRQLLRGAALVGVVRPSVVAAAAATPLWGKLGGGHGRKLLLEVALVGFEQELAAV